MATSIASVRWHRSQLAETDASDHASAACYRCPEHVGIEAVVIAELKFSDIQRHVLGAHLVERADHAALEQRPETFNRVRVNRTDHVLFFAMVNHRVGKRRWQINVAGPGIRSEQANLIGHGFPDELGYARTINVFQDAGDNIALTLYSADDWRLVGGHAALAASLIPVAIFVLAADPSLINLDNAAELRFRRDQRSANFVAHGMGRLVAAKAHHALDLQGAHSLLAGKHEMGDAEPVAERLLSVLENRPGEARESIALRRARSALPVEGLVAGGVVQIVIAATRAGDALRPPAGDQVAETGFVVTDRKPFLELPSGHLRDGLRTFCHDGYPSGPSMEGYCHA